MFFVYSTSKGQSLLPLKTVKIESLITVSTDLKYLYITNHQGDIIKYDTSGTQINIFSPNNGTLISSIEARFPLKVFVFNKDIQTYLFLDKQFNPSPEYQLSLPEVDYVNLATFNGRQHLWLVDIGNLNLVKYDLNLNTIISNSALQNYILNDINTLNFIKTYQHQVYVNNQNVGIMVFDDFGNYIKTLPYKGLDFFEFLHDELYFLQNNTLKFVNLYNHQERSIEFQTDSIYEFVLTFEGRIFLFTKEEMHIYKIVE